jgi:ABC-type branched-subunit amino acid transport system ATPase component
MGLGRTFQTMHLADSLTVAQNVALGYEAGLAGNNVLSQLAAPPGQVRRVNEAVTKAMDECGIAHLAELQAGALSTGQRRLVELARCLAGPFEILLLDEPSSGLDAAETAELGALLEHVRVERGCTILLVEHDMSLVMNVCSYIYVLDFGKLIFQGAPQAVAASPVVREAYLGVPTPNTSHLDARQ